MSISHLLKDYTPFPYAIHTTELLFDLTAELTHVTSWLEFERTADSPCEMVLDGEHLGLVSISIDDEDLIEGIDFVVNASGLTLLKPPANGILSIVTTCTPNTNTSLSGLFATGAHLMTQCEAQGFRRMTYFPDRPDVLSVFTVQLLANKVDFPVLLSNGNLIAQADLEHDGHTTTWHDPFPKPSYLFALVAGQLACLEETVEQDGLSKLLQVYVEAHDLPKAQFAMDSLKASIHWDKRRFGLPLDLERFMIVATSDFNMGAMENKGLNIFNTKFVLAHPETASDVDFENVEAVVGHEYFHNWTGNRVTCRDWFQLSLKEGLTVYRDQEFSSDQLAEGLTADAAVSARAVKRIDDVSALRTSQFAEDAGPMAHPIRPNAYEEINNFYTMTVYEKGAEVVRMYETLLGTDGFRRGMDLYFERHDGGAVTCDDFRAAMADANNVNLTQFGRWYEQAGTPTVTVTGEFNEVAQTYTLHVSQSNPAVGIELLDKDLVKLPLHIPFNIGLIDANGFDLPLNETNQTNSTLNLTEINQSFVFSNIKATPTPSLNRRFGAPIVVQFDYTTADLCFLMRHDSDSFNRWDAAQQLFSRCILSQMHTPSEVVFDDSQIAALAELLSRNDFSPAYRAQLFTLPSFAYLSQLIARDSATHGALDPQALFTARDRTSRAIANAFSAEWMIIYAQLNKGGDYIYSGAAAGERSLKNLALRQLAQADTSNDNRDNILAILQNQYNYANNMTDRSAALAIAVQSFPTESIALIADFYTRFENEPLVIDKWFTTQATNTGDEHNAMMVKLKQLLNHSAFENPNPNRLRSLIFAFCNANPRHFHQENGAGYAFWAEQVLAIDAKNPQVAARLARTLEHWRDYAEPYRSNMQNALAQIAASSALSQDVREVVDKALR